MQRIKNKIRIIGVCITVLTMFVVPAYAGAPVVVEYFGQNGCKNDFEKQQRFYEVVRRWNDVIFINCRITDWIKDDPKLSLEEEKQKEKEKIAEIKRNSLEKYGIHLFFNDFCSDRAEEYSQKTGELLRGNLGSIVNGRWVTSSYDVMAAVKLGATDGVKRIDVVREGEMLHVSLPEDMVLPKNENGKLVLFAYAPSTGMKIGEKIDVLMKPKKRTELINHMLDGYKRLVPLEKGEEKEKSSSGCSACSSGESKESAANTQAKVEKVNAAEQKEEESKENKENKEDKESKDPRKFFFRPVAAMKEIGVWNDSKSQYDVSLSSIISGVGVDLEKLGFVVLLQKGNDGVGEVVAAGEITPFGEQVSKPANTVKKSYKNVQQNSID